MKTTITTTVSSSSSNIPASSVFDCMPKCVFLKLQECSDEESDRLIAMTEHAERLVHNLMKEHEEPAKALQALLDELTKVWNGAAFGSVKKIGRKEFVVLREIAMFAYKTNPEKVRFYNRKRNEQRARRARNGGAFGNRNRSLHPRR